MCLLVLGCRHASKIYAHLAIILKVQTFLRCNGLKVTFMNQRSPSLPFIFGDAELCVYLTKRKKRFPLDEYCIL